MKTHTDNYINVVMYELFVFMLINITTLINIIIIYINIRLDYYDNLIAQNKLEKK